MRPRTFLLPFFGGCGGLGAAVGRHLGVADSAVDCNEDEEEDEEDDAGSEGHGFDPHGVAKVTGVHGHVIWKKNRKSN